MCHRMVASSGIARAKDATRRVLIFAAATVLAGLAGSSVARAAGVVSTCDESHLRAALSGGGSVTFSCSGDIKLTATIAISSNTSIDGTGQNVILDGQNSVQVLYVAVSATLALKNLTVANGLGGILDLGTLSITNVTLSGNYGGAISAPYQGNVSVTNSTFSLNGGAFGGDIYNEGGGVDIENSTFVGSNIYNSDGIVNVTNSTFSDDGIDNVTSTNFYTSTLTVFYSTFSNSYVGNGGGEASATLQNTLLANHYIHGDCGGSITDGGYNLDDDGSCGFSAANHSFSDNKHANLGTLGNYGGPTPTIPLLPGSVAIDAIPVGAAGCPGIDQRGVSRPQGPACDIGAFEVIQTQTLVSGGACNGVYGGTFKGNVTVSYGQNCRFMSGGITGNVTLNGGNLALSNMTVGGNTQVNRGTFSIGPEVAIKGDLQIQNIAVGSAQNQVCGATVQGNLQFHNNGTAVQIGSSSQSCAGNVIGGNLEVHNNTAGTALFYNTVTGNLQDQNNSAPTQVFNNVIGQNLQCQQNSSITGGGNTAKQKQGQCSGF